MLLAIIFVIAWPKAAFAHAPHDEITAIQISSGFIFDQTLFAIVRGNLVRSLDAGLTWWRVTKGLTREVLERAFLSPCFASDGRAFLSTEHSGLYFSRDSGVSWSRHKDGSLGSLTDLSFSPGFATDGEMVAADKRGRLWRSADFGSRWRDIPLLDARASCAVLTTGALLAGSEDGRLLVISREGRVLSSAAITSGGPVTCMALAEDGLAAIGTSRGFVLCSVSPAGEVRPLRRSLDRKHVTAISAYRSATNSTLLLATTWREGAYLSADMGKVWKHRGKGLTTDHQADDPAFARPHFSCVAVSPVTAQGQYAFIGGFDGLFRSIDGCRAWHELKDVLSEGLIVAFDVARSAEGPRMAAVTYCRGLYTKAIADDGRWAKARVAADHKRFHGFAHSPAFAADRTAFTASHGFALRTRDGGESWASIPLAGTLAGSSGGLAAQRLRGQRIGRSVFAKLPKSLRDRLRPLIESAGLNAELKRFSVYGAVFRLSPAFERDRLLYLGCARHGIFRSSDGGDHFGLMWNTAPDSLSDIELSPDFLADQTMFASLASGIYRSRDRGTSWEHLDGDRRRSGGRLAISPDFVRDRLLLLGSPHGLFRSADSGESWEGPIEIGGESRPIGAIALSPAFTSDREVLVYPIGRRLYRSTDGGETFEAAGADDAGLGLPLCQMTGFLDYPAMIRYSPDYPADPTLYVSTVDAIWRSRDGGREWTLMALPGHAVDRAESPGEIKL